LPASEQPAYSLLPSDDVYCEARSGDPLLAIPASEAEDLSKRLVAYANYIFSTNQPHEEARREFMKLVNGVEGEPA
jgi:hypothetical protein